MLSASASARAMPRTICESITPELPRAPMSAPCDIHDIILPAPSSGQLCASSMTARMVRCMFVPVSPSGTGKTLIALTEAACFCSQAAAAANISRSWPPESVSMVTRVAMVHPTSQRLLPSRSCGASALLHIAVGAAGGSGGVGPPCRCRMRMLSCVLLHSITGKGALDGQMPRLRQGHDLRPQHQTQALGALGTQGPKDEPPLQGERAEEDVRHRRSGGAAEHLHPLPAHPAQGYGVGRPLLRPRASASFSADSPANVANVGRGLKTPTPGGPKAPPRLS